MTTSLATSNSLRSFCSFLHFFLFFSLSSFFSLRFFPPTPHHRSSTFTFIFYKVDPTKLTGLSVQLICYRGPPGNSVSHANSWPANQSHVGDLFVSPIWEAFFNLPLCEGTLESIIQCLDFLSFVSVQDWEIFSSVWCSRFFFLFSFIILAKCKILATCRLSTCQGVV